MADDDDALDDPATEDREAPEAATARPAAGGKRRRIIIVAAVVALLAVVAAGAFTLLPGRTSGHGKALASAEDYVEAPAVVINMRDADGGSHFMKLHFVLVAAHHNDVDVIQKQMPLIIDAMQSFLRGLRPEDLDGSAAVYRVKEEMMVRTRQALPADRVSDILIQDMIEQ